MPVMEKTKQNDARLPNMLPRAWWDPVLFPANTTTDLQTHTPLTTQRPLHKHRKGEEEKEHAYPANTRDLDTPQMQAKSERKTRKTQAKRSHTQRKIETKRM